MGQFVYYYQLENISNSSLFKPIIYCNLKKIPEKDSFSLNIPLAIELKRYDTVHLRTMKLESCLLKAINNLGDNPVIKDFDVMFNPSYQTDVLKVLINVCKKKQFSVIWPGYFREGKLFYSEEGYLDYKTYDIENYDVTIVV